MSRRHLLTALLLGAMATSLVGCNSGSSGTPTSPIDLSPPQAPTNLRSMNQADIHRDWLLWTPSASASVSSYQIYSGDSPSGLNTLVATVDASSYDYILPLVGTATTEYYRVRAIGTNNVPSAFTNPVSVDRTAWDGGPAPTDPDPGTADPN